MQIICSRNSRNASRLHQDKILESKGKVAQTDIKYFYILWQNMTTLFLIFRTESNWVSCTVTDCNSRQDQAALRCTLSTAASIEMVWEASVASKVQACTWAESWSIHIYWPLHKKWSKRASTVAISNRDTFVPTVRICKIHEHAKKCKISMHNKLNCLYSYTERTLILPILSHTKTVRSFSAKFPYTLNSLLVCAMLKPDAAVSLIASVPCHKYISNASKSNVEMSSYGSLRYTL